MNHPYWSTIFAIKAVHSMKWYSFRSKHQQPGPQKYDNLFSCTLRCKYRVARNRDSWLLFISEVRLCANLQNYRRIWCHNASTSCSSDVTPVSDVIFWPHPDRYIGVPSHYKDSLSKSGIFVKNIRRSCDGLVYIMGIPVLLRRHLYTETTLGMHCGYTDYTYNSTNPPGGISCCCGAVA